MKKPVLIALIAVIVIFIILVLTQASFHLTREEQSVRQYSAFGMTEPYGHDFRTYEKLAIITPKTTWRKRGLQMAIAKNLKESLSKAQIVYKVLNGGEGFTQSCPTVSIYQNYKEAMQAKPDCLVYVIPEDWHYSFPPILYARWKAHVVIEGKSPDKYLSSIELPFPYYFKSDTEAEGRVVGIFSGRYLTSKVAKSIAEDTVKSISENVKKNAEEHFEDGKEGNKT